MKACVFTSPAWLGLAGPVVRPGLQGAGAPSRWEAQPHITVQDEAHYQSHKTAWPLTAALPWGLTLSKPPCASQVWHRQCDPATETCFFATREAGSTHWNCQVDPEPLGRSMRSSLPWVPDTVLPLDNSN